MHNTKVKFWKSIFIFSKHNLNHIIKNETLNEKCQDLKDKTQRKSKK